MKKQFILVLMMLFVSAAIYAGTTLIESFTAESGGNNVTLRWKSSSEENTGRYEIERSSDQIVFQKIDSKDAVGNANQYSYIDEEAFYKKDNNGKIDLAAKNIYYYRLKIVYKDNSAIYSDIVNVTHKASSIKRTWGMIKEMFR